MYLTQFRDLRHSVDTHQSQFSYFASPNNTEIPYNIKKCGFVQTLHSKKDFGHF